MNRQLAINDHVVIDQGQMIGKGSTGNVYLGWSTKDTNKKYAVKAIDLSEITNEVTQYLLSCQIVALTQLSKLNLPSIVKLEEVAFLEGFCYLVMEMLEGGPLSDYIKENPDGIDEQEAIKIFMQMFQAYRELKNQGIVHRDIKPDNMIFRKKCERFEQNRSSKQLCIIDFGYCTKQDVPNRPTVYYNVGSPKYMSPEAFKQNIYSEKSDIWALGIILYEMLHGKTIDSGMDMQEYLKFMETNQLPIDINISQPVKDLLAGMLTFNHQQRITCEGIGRMLSKLNPSKQKTSFEINQQQAWLVEGLNRKSNPFYRSVILSERPNTEQLDLQSEQSSFLGGFDKIPLNQSPREILYSPINTDSINYTSNSKEIQMGMKKVVQNNYKSPQYSHPEIRQTKNLRNFMNAPQIRQVQPMELEKNEYQISQFKQQQNQLGNTRAFLKHFITTQNQDVVYAKNTSKQRPSVVVMTRPHHPLTKSQIFGVAHDLSANTDNRMLSNQSNPQPFQNPNYMTSIIHNVHPSVNEIRSDNLIINKEFNSRTNNVDVKKQLIKSYSIQQVQMNKQQRRNDFVFVSNHNQNLIPNVESRTPKNLDLILKRSQFSKPAHLKSTMPGTIQRSFIQINFIQGVGLNQEHEVNRQQQQLDSFRRSEYENIDRINQSTSKKHEQYFVQNLTTTQNDNFIDKQTIVSDLNSHEVFLQQRPPSQKANILISPNFSTQPINSMPQQQPKYRQQVITSKYQTNRIRKGNILHREKPFIQNQLIVQQQNVLTQKVSGEGGEIKQQNYPSLFRPSVQEHYEANILPLNFPNQNNIAPKHQFSQFHVNTSGQKRYKNPPINNSLIMNQRVMNTNTNQLSNYVNKNTSMTPQTTKKTKITFNLGLNSQSNNSTPLREKQAGQVFGQNNQVTNQFQGPKVFFQKFSLIQS